MSTVRNYQKELDKITEGLIDTPKLLLHSCCAPCSSYVLEYLRNFFRITVFYYNPNISIEPEYRKRLAEQKRLIEAYNAKLDGRPLYPILIQDAAYEPERFFEIAKGLEKCPEGGERCLSCYELRLRKTSQMAAAGEYDYFTTTLTISPLKNAVRLNEIGEKLSKECGVKWLPSDFKKKDGYKRSIELSKEYGLYRQNYCGCVYSKNQ